MKKSSSQLQPTNQWLWFSLISTFLWGFTAHGYAFSDNSVSHDSLREFHAQILGNNIKMGSGRIFTPLYRDLIGNDITLPWLSGILALLWLGLAVYLTIRIFSVESKLIVFLIAGIFSTNISISSTIATYIHDLDSYMFSLLCAVSAVYLWKQHSLGWLPGSLLITLSIGIYQSFLFAAITLIILVCIFSLVNKASFRDVFLSGLKSVAMILLGGLLYYVFMRGFLKLTGNELVKGDYNSMDLILFQPPSTIFLLIKSAYKDWFLRLYHAYSSYPDMIISAITICLFTLSSAGIIIVLRIRKWNISDGLLMLLLIALLPLGMNLIHVLVIGGNHDLMTFPIWLFYLFPLLLTDWLTHNRDTQNILHNSLPWARCICMLLISVLLYGNVRFSNGMYMKKDLEYDAYLSYMTRVVGTMESQEEYIPGETPVIFVGMPESQNQVIPGFKEFWNVTGMISTDVIYTYEPSRFQAYFDYVLNSPINLADWSSWQEACYREDVQQMPCYPSSGSIVLKDGLFIVKLGEPHENEKAS